MMDDSKTKPTHYRPIMACPETLSKLIEAMDEKDSKPGKWGIEGGGAVGNLDKSKTRNCATAACEMLNKAGIPTPREAGADTPGELEDGGGLLPVPK
jgi:hypothetical protein